MSLTTERMARRVEDDTTERLAGKTIAQLEAVAKRMGLRFSQSKPPRARMIAELQSELAQRAADRGRQ